MERRFASWPARPLTRSMSWPWKCSRARYVSAPTTFRWSRLTLYPAKSFRRLRRSPPPWPSLLRCRQEAWVEVRRHNAVYCGDCFVRFFRDQVERAIHHDRMFSSADKVLVAVSGGKDSLALWDVLLDDGALFALSPGARVRIEPSGAPIEIDNRSYRGALEVFGNARRTLTIVNELPLEEYLLGVVPNELSPATFGQIEALKEDVVQLTEAQRQAAHTIAAVKAGEQELRRQAPAPYWYSNPAALDPGLAKGAQWAGAAPVPRRPPAARSEPRDLRGRDTAPTVPPPAAR